MSSNTPPMKSVQRAFEVLHALWELRQAGPSKIADHLDLSKSTAHVYLRTLESTGYVVNERGKYRLSYRFLTMGSRLKHRSRLYHTAREEMTTLAQETGELITLFIEEEGSTILLHQEKGNRSLELGTYSGMALPLHPHASGKIFLAYMDPERRNEILNDDLEAMTEYTVTDSAELKSILEEIHEEGFAFDWDQQVKGMGVIALPIFVNDELKATLAVACPTGRVQNESYRNDVRQKLQGAVDTLTINYQYGD